MSKLSKRDSQTIREARAAVHLVISGAIRNLESQYGPDDEADRRIAVDALILHVREELGGWATTAEDTDGAVELDNEDTRLVE